VPDQTEQPEFQESKRCPMCGRGVLVDITFREQKAVTPGQDEMQTPESHQVETYSCGHEVVGPRLDVTANGDNELDAERRSSDDTTPSV
jgi:hypothetical protein